MVNYTVEEARILLKYERIFSRKSALTGDVGAAAAETIAQEDDTVVRSNQKREELEVRELSVAERISRLKPASRYSRSRCECGIRVVSKTSHKALYPDREFSWCVACWRKDKIEAERWKNLQAVLAKENRRLVVLNPYLKAVEIPLLKEEIGAHKGRQAFGVGCSSSSVGKLLIGRTTDA